MNKQYHFIITEIDNGYILEYDIFKKYYDDLEKLLENIRNVVKY